MSQKILFKFRNLFQIFVIFKFRGPKTVLSEQKQRKTLLCNKMK